MNLRTYHLKNVNSTNDVAIRKIKSGKKNGIVICENQKKGRGKYGNQWVSLKGNLFVSIFYKAKKINNLKYITKYNCLLIKKTLNRFTKEQIKIKLPNDLLIKNKKFCGILQEIIKYKNNNFIIVGIGVNIHKSPNIDKYQTTHLSLYNENVNKMTIFKNIKKCYEKEILCI